MIDTTFLTSFPKEVSKEAAQFKSLFNIFNELKLKASYLKSTVEIESKSLESLGKNVILASKAFTADTSSLLGEDFSKTLLFLQNYLSTLESLLNELSTNATNIHVASISKMFSAVSELAAELTKGSCENITALVRELTNARQKYKNYFQKTEKSYKEVEGYVNFKKKSESDEKTSYNLTIKDKNEDKILNGINEFDENKALMVQSFEECKRLEVVLNEMMKNIFLNSIQFIFKGIKVYDECFEELMNNKERISGKIKNEILLPGYEGMLQVDLDLNNQEAKMSEAKGTKLDIPNSVLEFLTCNNPVTPFNIDEHFNKNNFLSSVLTDNLLSFTCVFLQCLTSRKKILMQFLKTITDIIKQYENSITLSNRLIKNLIQPKLSIIQHCPFLIQMGEFLRSLFELMLKKFEDFSKHLLTYVSMPIEHMILKDITSDEVIITNIYNKIQKEYNSFKGNITKLASSKEKISVSIAGIKESLQIDPSSFSKFEKMFLGMRSEESLLSDNITDMVKKYKKFLEESMDIIKKCVVSYKEKEILRSKEVKDSLLTSIQSKEKIFTQILEFLEYRNQISRDSNSILTAIKSIYNSFAKEYDVNINEKTINDLLNEIPNAKDFSNDVRNIITVINDIVFINREEILTLKDLTLATLLPDEEIAGYKDKLVFLKQNQRKISVKMMNTGKRLCDGIFSIDDDEALISSYICALNERILLQGKLYITNKKLVFYSWFNNSTLFGRTLIEIVKDDIVDVEKKSNMIFDNMILVKTRTTSFLLCSFMYRDKCYSLLRETFFGEKEDSVKDIEIPATEAQDPTKRKISKSECPSPKKDVDIDADEENDNEIGMVNVDKHFSKKRRSAKSFDMELENKNLTAEEININPQKENQHQENTNPYVNEFKNILTSNDIFEKIRQYDNHRINIFTAMNKRNFNTQFLVNSSIGDLPLPIIFNSLYHPDKTAPELDNENFIMNYLNLRQDYNINFIKITQGDLDSIIPRYYSDFQNYYKIFKHSDECDTNIKEFIKTELNMDQTAEQKIEYKYNYTHPILKRKFMGPSKVEIEDIVKVFFVSPTCLIVEVWSYISGFIMMDTFYSVLQYKFDSAISFDEASGKIISDTKLNISLMLEFVKETWWKNKISTEATSDTELLLQTTIYPVINKVLDGRKIFHKEMLLKEIEKPLPLPLPMPVEDDDRKYQVVDLTGKFLVDVIEHIEIPKGPVESGAAGALIEEKKEEIVEENSIDDIKPIEAPHIKKNFEGETVKIRIIENSYVILLLFLIVMLICLRLFPVEIATVVILNVSGFFFIFRKMHRIEDKVDKLLKLEELKKRDDVCK